MTSQERFPEECKIEAVKQVAESHWRNEHRGRYPPTCLGLVC